MENLIKIKVDVWDHPRSTRIKKNINKSNSINNNNNNNNNNDNNSYNYNYDYRKNDDNNILVW